MRRSDSQTPTHTPRAAPGTDDYKTKVAEPTMQAIDAMPKRFRELIHELGYIEVYRLWRRGRSVEEIRRILKR